MRGLSLPPHRSRKARVRAALTGSNRLLVTLAAICVLLAGIVGCGDEGVGDDAVVAVYASAPLCAGAKQELARSDGQAGDVRVQVICLDDAEGRGRLDLATIGANARQAVEDSRTVAYIGEPTPSATRFSAPILEAADIAQLPGVSGAPAMSRVVRAIELASDSGSLRESVQDALVES